MAIIRLARGRVCDTPEAAAPQLPSTLLGAGGALPEGVRCNARQRETCHTSLRTLHHRLGPQPEAARLGTRSDGGTPPHRRPGRGSSTMRALGVQLPNDNQVVIPKRPLEPLSMARAPSTWGRPRLWACRWYDTRREWRVKPGTVLTQAPWLAQERLSPSGAMQGARFRYAPSLVVSASARAARKASRRPVQAVPHPHDAGRARRDVGQRPQ